MGGKLEEKPAHVWFAALTMRRRFFVATPRNGIATRARSRFVLDLFDIGTCRDAATFAPVTAIGDDRHREWWGSTTGASA